MDHGPHRTKHLSVRLERLSDWANDSSHDSLHTVAFPSCGRTGSPKATGSTYTRSDARSRYVEQHRDLGADLNPRTVPGSLRTSPGQTRSGVCSRDDNRRPG